MSQLLPAPANAAPVLAPMEPTYPIPTTSTLWVSADGRFQLQNTRINDGASCYLSNTDSTGQWLAANGGDGGNGDGRVCLPTINKSPGDAVLTYRSDWSVDASASAVTVNLTLPKLIDSTTFNTVCSTDPSGRWTASNLNSATPSCTLTYKAGATYAGSWTLNALNTSIGSTALPIGYSVPTMKVNGASINLPGVTVLNAPTPYYFTTASVGYTNQAKWVYKNGQLYAQWKVQASEVGSYLNYNLEIDGTVFPVNTTITNIRPVSGPREFLIEVPYLSLTGTGGSFDTRISAIEYFGTFTSTNPYGGALPFPGFGEPIGFDTPRYNGLGGTLNQTWAHLLWDYSTYQPATYAKAMSPFSIPQKGQTWAQFTITVNQATLDVSHLCEQIEGAYSQLDTSRTPYMMMGGVRTDLSATQSAGKCGSDLAGPTWSGYNTKVVLTGFPQLTASAVVYIPIKNIADRGNNTTYGDFIYVNGSSTSAAAADYQVRYVTYNLTASVTAQNSVVASNSVSDTVAYNLSLLNVPTTALPTTATTVQQVAVGSCALNPTFTNTATQSYKLVSSPNLGPDGLACTADDVSGWVYEVTLTVSSTNGTTWTGGGSVNLNYSVPAWAAPGTKITVTPSVSGSVTSPLNPIKGTTTATPGTTTVVNANVVGQEIQRDYVREPVGTVIGWNLIGFNGTLTNGTATFTYQVDPGNTVLSSPAITAYGGAALSMVSVSQDGLTWVPWNPSSTVVPKFIRMTVPNFTAGWVGNLRFSVDTDGSPDGSVARVQALPGTTSLSGLAVPAITWKETALYETTPAIDLVKVVDGAVVEANGNGIQDAGDQVKYKLTVTNTGYVDLKSVSLTDSITTVTCLSTTLSKGASMVCTAIYTLGWSDLEAGKVDNTATAQGISTWDNVTKVTDTDSATVTLVQVPAIDLVKTITNGSSFNVGDTIKYDLTVANKGNVTLTNVTLNDALTGISTITCDSVLTPLAPGASVTCHGTYTVAQADAEASKVVNNASTRGEHGTTTVTDDASVEVPINPTPVALPGTPEVNDPCGTGNAVWVVPANAAPITWTLNPDGKLIASVAAGYSFPNGQVSHDFGLAPETNISVCPVPAITLHKTADKTVVTAVGEVVTYTFVVTNTGNTPLSNVLVSDARVTQVNCPATILAVDEAMTCTAQYSVTAEDVAATFFTNVALASGSNGGTTVTDTDEARVGVGEILPPETPTSGVTFESGYDDAQAEAAMKAAAAKAKAAAGRIESGVPTGQINWAIFAMGAVMVALGGVLVVDRALRLKK